MSDHKHHHLHENHEDLGFEREDLGGRPIFAFIASTLVIGVLTYYAIWGLFHFLDAYSLKHQQTRSPWIEVQQPTRTVEEQEIKNFPEPRLEANERSEINDFRYKEEEELNSYGWVDEKTGVAHIPISQAMQLIAQRGLPTTPQTGTMPFSPVNMSRAAAEASDTSSVPAPQAQQKGKKQ